MNHMYHTHICIRARKTPSKNDKYHTFGLPIYYEVNKPKKWEKTKKKTQECLNNIRIRFPTYENECYARQTRISFVFSSHSLILYMALDGLFYLLFYAFHYIYIMALYMV